MAKSKIVYKKYNYSGRNLGGAEKYRKITQDQEMIIRLEKLLKSCKAEDQKFVESLYRQSWYRRLSQKQIDCVSDIERPKKKKSGGT